MSYEFERDANKAEDNLRKHRVTVDDASAVFADPLAMLMPDPDTPSARNAISFSAHPQRGGCSW